MASFASREPALNPSGAPFGMSLAGAIGLQMAFYALGPFVALPPSIGGLAAFAAVTLSVLAAGLTVPWLEFRRAWLLILPAAALATLAFLRVDATSPVAAALVLFCLLSSGALVGGLVGSRIEAPGHLLVVAIVSSFADLYSVFTPGAPSQMLVESELLLPLVAIPWCPLGSRAFLPILGVGDVVMSALYLTTARAHGIGRVRMLIALVVGYAACLAVLVATERVLPALPFLGLSVVLIVPEARRLPRADRAQAVVGVVFLALVFGALALR